MNELALRELALFAGAGGGILGGHLLGWRTVAAVEIEEYPRAILLQRQLDGILPRFPIWDDVRTFDGKPWRGKVDIVTGGFPCQDISAAGKGKGIEGERSGLWKEMFRIICEVRPRFSLIENSPMLTIRGLDRVLCDLASVGYDAEWGVIGAHHAGAPHKRDRIWVLADSRRKHGKPGDSARMEATEGEWPQRTIHDKPSGEGLGNVADTLNSGVEGLRERENQTNDTERDKNVADTEPAGLERQRTNSGEPENPKPRHRSTWWDKDPSGEPEPELGRVAHGVAYRVDRLKAIGNGQVPAVVKLAWETLSKGLYIP